MKRMVLAALCTLPAVVVANSADPITVAFSGMPTTNCGFPASQLVSGSLTYRALPPIAQFQNEAAYAVDSFSITIAGHTAAGGPADEKLWNVANDLDLGTVWVDQVIARLEFAEPVGDLVPNFRIVGLRLMHTSSSVKPAPNLTLTSVALPTGSADLAGFVGFRRLTLGVENTSTGASCALHADIPASSVVFSTDPPPDQPPTADAGVDQSIRLGSQVLLDGRASFDDNTPMIALEYLWTFAYKPAESSAVLLGANTPNPTFIADVADTYSLQLVVTDGAGNVSAPDFVEASAGNLPPTAAAGPDQLVVVGHTVTLDGTPSWDPDGDTIIHTWNLQGPEGSTAMLDSPSTWMPTFAPDVEGTYVAQLVVSDFLGNGSPATVTITAVVPNDYAERVTVAVAQAVMNLPPDSVSSGGNQSALQAFLQQAAAASSQGNTASQVQSLQRALMRTDGCAMRGRPDLAGAERDWITTCSAQAEVYPPLKAALDAVAP